MRTLREGIRSVVDAVGGRVHYQFSDLVQQQRDALAAQWSQADKYSDPRCLTRFGYRCFSQNEEDGIIDEVFRRVGRTNGYFIEFGVQGGLENNTVALLLGGWSGLWIEGHPGFFGVASQEFRAPIESGQLQLINKFVTAENINTTFLEAGIPSEPDLLSIDIDGNDYWIWKAIETARPRVVVIEYNASLGRSARVVRPYNAENKWDGSSAFGASLAALEALGKAKGYSLVGCNISGVNAFFVREDLTQDHFLRPYSSERHYEPPRYGFLGKGHPPKWGQFMPAGT